MRKFIWSKHDNSVWSEDRRYYYFINNKKFHLCVAGSIPNLIISNLCDADDKYWRRAIESAITDLQKTQN